MGKIICKIAQKMTILAIQEAIFRRLLNTLTIIDTTLDTHLKRTRQHDAYAHTHTAKCYVALSVSRQDETRQDETQKTCGALLDSACGCCKKIIVCEAS